MATVTPLFPLIACDVPTVYSNKQSYYECLCYIGYKLNEAIEAINTFTDDYQKYTDEKVAELKSYIDKLNADMKTYVDKLDDEINTRIDLEVGDLDGKINTLEEDIRQQMNEIITMIYRLNDNMKQYVDSEIEQLYQFVKSYIPSHIIVMNPTRGYETDLNTALADMWDDLRYYGLTCSEFDNLQLTCSVFENYYLSAHEFDLYGKKRLVKDPDFYMFDPISGEYSLIKNVVYHIVENWHRYNAVTATSFDTATIIKAGSTTTKLNITNYDKSGLTCLNIDTYGGNYFTAT